MQRPIDMADSRQPFLFPEEMLLAHMPSGGLALDGMPHARKDSAESRASCPASTNRRGNPPEANHPDGWRIASCRRIVPQQTDGRRQCNWPFSQVAGCWRGVPANIGSLYMTPRGYWSETGAVRATPLAGEATNRQGRLACSAILPKPVRASFHHPSGPRRSSKSAAV